MALVDMQREVAPSGDWQFHNDDKFGGAGHPDSDFNGQSARYLSSSPHRSARGGRQPRGGYASPHHSPLSRRRGGQPPATSLDHSGCYKQAAAFSPHHSPPRGSTYRDQLRANGEALQRAMEGPAANPPLLSSVHQAHPMPNGCAEASTRRLPFNEGPPVASMGAPCTGMSPVHSAPSHAGNEFSPLPQDASPGAYFQLGPMAMVQMNSASSQPSTSPAVFVPIPAPYTASSPSSGAVFLPGGSVCHDVGADAPFHGQFPGHGACGSPDNSPTHAGAQPPFSTPTLNMSPTNSHSGSQWRSREELLRIAMPQGVGLDWTEIAKRLQEAAPETYED